MADWGLYTALRGTDNWAQRRQDKMLNMQIAQQQKVDQEKRVEKSMLAEEEINKYFDAIAKLEVLPEDQERIKEVERQSRQRIIQGLAAVNGDVSRYVSSGGITDLHEYNNSIMESKQVQNGLQNKENMEKIIKDKQAGRWIAPISYEEPVLDEKGEQVMENGKPVMETLQMTVDQQLAGFKDGTLDVIEYNGSEDPVNVNSMTFHSTPKNPQDPYSKDNIVTTSDIKFYVMNKGKSEEYADALADNYADRGVPWYWGNLSPEQKAIDDYKGGKGRSSGGSSKGILLDSWKNSVEALQPGTEIVPNGKEQDEMFYNLGIQPLAKGDATLGGSYHYSGTAYGKDSDIPINLSEGEILAGSGKYVNQDLGNGKTAYGWMFTAMFPDDSHDVTTNLWNFVNTEAVEGEERNFKDTGNGWKGQVWIPMDGTFGSVDFMDNTIFQSHMNSFRNDKSDAHYTPPSTGNQVNDLSEQELQRAGAEYDRANDKPHGTGYQALKTGQLTLQ